MSHNIFKVQASLFVCTAGKPSGQAAQAGSAGTGPGVRYPAGRRRVGLAGRRRDRVCQSNRLGWAASHLTQLTKPNGLASSAGQEAQLVARPAGPAGRSKLTRQAQQAASGGLSQAQTARQAGCPAETAN